MIWADLFFFFSSCLPFFPEQTCIVKSELRSHFDHSLWGRLSPWVELGHPLISGWWGGSIQPHFTTQQTPLRKHVPAKRCSDTTVHVVTEQQRERRDYHPGIARVVKTLDNNSVREQCGMNHKDDFDLWLLREDKWMCVRWVIFRLDINGCT